jgi:hypothetical protein
MPGSFSLPNPNSPATSDPLVSLPVRQNFQAIQAQINSADGAALQAKTVQEQALADQINPRLRGTNRGESYFVSGLNPAVPGSGLVLTIPAGVAYVGGYYVAYAGGTITVVANQDTYLDISNIGVIAQVGVSNNATAGMTLTANSIRLARVVSNANIVAVLQNSVHPTIVSPMTTDWFGFDPLGNPVYNTNPNPSNAGLFQYYAGYTTASTADLSAGQGVVAIIPPFRRYRVDVKLGQGLQGTGGTATNVFASLFDNGSTPFPATGSAATGTIFDLSVFAVGTTNFAVPATLLVVGANTTSSPITKYFYLGQHTATAATPCAVLAGNSNPVDFIVTLI